MNSLHSLCFSLVLLREVSKEVSFWNGPCALRLLRWERSQAKRYYDLIPPYIAHKDDWLRLLPVWVDQGPKVFTLASFLCGHKQCTLRRPWLLVSLVFAPTVGVGLLRKGMPVSVALPCSV